MRKTVILVALNLHLVLAAAAYVQGAGARGMRPRSPARPATTRVTRRVSIRLSSMWIRCHMGPNPMGRCPTDPPRPCRLVANLLNYLLGLFTLRTSP